MSGNTFNDLKDFVFEPEWSKATGSEKYLKPERKLFEKKKAVKKQRREFDFNFYIDQKTSEAIKQILRKDGITRKVENIINDLILKKRYGISIKWKNDEKKFFKVSEENKNFCYIDDILKHIIKSKKHINVVKEIKTKIEGNFSYVLKCNKTGQIFPPTSHDLFVNMIDSHIIESNIDLNKKDYIEQLEKINDTDIISSFKEQEFWKKHFVINNKDKVNSLDLIKNRILENKKGFYFKTKDKIRDIALNIYQNENICHLVKELKGIKDEIIKKDLISNFILISKKSNLILFKRNKCLFVSAYKLKEVDIENLNSKSKKIVQYVRINKNTTIKKLINDNQFIDDNKRNILQDIHWLLTTGYIRQFESGEIETILTERK